MKESRSNFEMTEDKLIENTGTRRVDISERAVYQHDKQN